MEQLDDTGGILDRLISEEKLGEDATVVGNDHGVANEGFDGG